jgi:hypothetical protein
MTPQNDLIQYAESICLDRLLINVIIYFLIDRLLELGLYDCDVMGQVKVILTTQSIWSSLLKIKKYIYLTQTKSKVLDKQEEKHKIDF